MKKERVTETIEFLGQYYTFTHYFGSEVLKIERQRITYWGKLKWDLIYFGHIDPLEKAIDFFKTTRPASLPELKKK